MRWKRPRSDDVHHAVFVTFDIPRKKFGKNFLSGVGFAKLEKQNSLFVAGPRTKTASTREPAVREMCSG